MKTTILEKFSLLAIPLLISLGVSLLFYPGFMSYDTLHALRGARNGVTDSMWPPMVSYVWRMVDLVSPNPSVMHFSQLFLLLSSIFYIVFFFTKKIIYAIALIVFYLSIPPILGTLAVIWKDVLMAAFFIAGFALIVSMRLAINRWVFIFLALLAIALIFLGVCSRHNAIAGAVPLLFFLAWVMCLRVLKTSLCFWLGVISLGSALTCTVFFTKIQLDHYSFPSLTRMNSSTDAFMQSVRVLDVAGASLCVGKTLFSDMAPQLSLAEISRLYDPKHINLSAELLNQVGVDNRINKIWLGVAAHHPICFLYNKLQLTKYLIGANQGVPFLITAPSVDTNEYGYALTKSKFRDSVVRYIVEASRLPFFKPWILYLLSIGAFFSMAMSRRLTVAYMAMFFSAVFYFISLVIFGNAADARLPFYTLTTLSMFTFISIFELVYAQSRRAVR